MLTKQDLQSIGNLIDEKLDAKFTAEVSPIRKDIKTIKSRLKKVEKDLSTAINLFDGHIIDLEKRADRVDHHLGLPRLTS